MTDTESPLPDKSPKALLPQDMPLMEITRAEIDSQVATAKRYPRNLREFVDEAASHASIDEDVAGECFYRLERKDRRTGHVKIIEGPSARLAEIVAYCWKNCRAGARVIEETERYIVAQGFFIDLEANVAVTSEVRRRITDSSGNRYSDDMIIMTANAACSIALRNAVFKAIPRAFWSKAYDKAVATFRGQAETLASRRDKMFAYFRQMGVKPEWVLASIGRTTLDEVTLDDLVRLRGKASAVRDGEITLEEAFPDPEKAKHATKSSAMAAALKPEGTQQTEEKPKPSPQKPGSHEKSDAPHSLPGMA